MSETPEIVDPPRMPLVARMASRLGTFAPVSAIAGIVLVQIGLVPPLGAFMFFQIGLLCGLLALIVGVVTLVLTRKEGAGPAKTAGWLGMASGALMITITVAGAGDGLGSPPINDITTNVDDPPAFASASEVPDFAGRDMSYPEEFVEIVRGHYTDLEPLRDARDPARAFDHALSTAEDLGWEVVHSDPSEGTIDAREESALFRFVDDVVIRIRPDGSGSVIDVRSKSRDGRGDLGANAARIRAFFEAYQR